MQIVPSHSSSRIRFGEFEVDVQSHELLRSGSRIRLQEKSFLVLNELLKRPGEVVIREELAAALWPKEYFVDAEHGLNTAVRRLREALGDSAEEPRYVETVPKLGYRFIGVIEALFEPTERQAPAGFSVSAPAAEEEGIAAPPANSRTPDRRPRLEPRTAGVIVAVAALAVAATFVLRSRSDPTAERAPTLAAASRSSQAVEELLDRARFLRNTKRFVEANQFVEEALRLDPANPEALAGLAMTHLSEGNQEQARETAKRALERDPNAWEAHRVLGSLAFRAGDMAGAENHYRRTVEAEPSDYKSHNRLARHLLERGQFDEAKVEMLESRRLAPDDPDVQNIWIDYALRIGDYEEAIRLGEIWFAVWEKQIAEAERQSGTAFGALGLVRKQIALAYLGARRHEEALAMFGRVAPDDVLFVALVDAHAGRVSEARAILAAHEATGAVTGSTRSSSLAESMATAYIALADFERAFAWLGREVDAGEYPGWLYQKLFEAIRRDPRWPAFAERLEIEFFRGKQRPLAPNRARLLGSSPPSTGESGAPRTADRPPG